MTYKMKEKTRKDLTRNQTLNKKKMKLMNKKQEKTCSSDDEDMDSHQTLFIDLISINDYSIMSMKEKTWGGTV